MMQAVSLIQQLNFCLQHKAKWFMNDQIILQCPLLVGRNMSLIQIPEEKQQQLYNYFHPYLDVKDRWKKLLAQ